VGEDRDPPAGLDEFYKTQRSLARWRTAPYLYVVLGVIAVVWFIAGKDTNFNFDLTISIGISIVVSLAGVGAFLKIRKDGQEKERLRQLVDKLQDDWDQADKARQEAEVRAASAEGALAEIRRSDREGD
jgi:preprotein translocase subunit SecF